MEEKITIWIATSEWNSDEGIFVKAKPFRTIEEAVEWAESENKSFVNLYGEDCETDRYDNSGIYTSYYDYYVNIDITKHEL
jgi:hypothetical protein